MVQSVSKQSVRGTTYFEVKCPGDNLFRSRVSGGQPTSKESVRGTTYFEVECPWNNFEVECPRDNLLWSRLSRGAIYNKVVFWRTKYFKVEWPGLVITTFWSWSQMLLSATCKWLPTASSVEKWCIPTLSNPISSAELAFFFFFFFFSSNKILKQNNVAGLDHVELLHLLTCPSSFHPVLGHKLP